MGPVFGRVSKAEGELEELLSPREGSLGERQEPSGEGAMLRRGGEGGVGRQF